MNKQWATTARNAATPRNLAIAGVGGILLSAIAYVVRHRKSVRYPGV